MTWKSRVLLAAVAVGMMVGSAGVAGATEDGGSAVARTDSGPVRGTVAAESLVLNPGELR